MKEKESQIGLWIDNGLLYSNLTPTEKLILADVIVLSKGDNRYYKTNESIEKFTNVSNRTVRNAIKSLKDKGLINAIMYNPYGNVKTKRILIPCLECIDKMFNAPKDDLTCK